MGRKNRRKSAEYRDRLGFNPRKYVRPTAPTHSYQTAWTGEPSRWSRGNDDNRAPMRGDIWFAELGEHFGTSVQGGCRPVLVISNDIGNTHADTINVLPMTGHLKKPNLPCHTPLMPDAISDARQPLNESMILAEQVTTISKAQLRNYVGKVEDAALQERIDRTIGQQLGLQMGIQMMERSAGVETAGGNE